MDKACLECGIDLKNVASAPEDNNRCIYCHLLRKQKCLKTKYRCHLQNCNESFWNILSFETHFSQQHPQLVDKTCFKCAKRKFVKAKADHECPKSVRQTCDCKDQKCKVCAAFVCGVCFNIFKYGDNQSYQEHIKLCSREKTLPEKQDDEEYARCLFCYEIYVEKSEVLQSILEGATESTEDTNEAGHDKAILSQDSLVKNLTKFMCGPCKSIQETMDRPSKKFPCIDCSNCFYSLHALVLHTKSLHSKLECCDVCGRQLKHGLYHNHDYFISCRCEKVTCKACKAYVCRLCASMFRGDQLAMFREHVEKCGTKKGSNVAKQSTVSPKKEVQKGNCTVTSSAAMEVEEQSTKHDNPSDLTKKARNTLKNALKTADTSSNDSLELSNGAQNGLTNSLEVVDMPISYFDFKERIPDSIKQATNKPAESRRCDCGMLDCKSCYGMIKSIKAKCQVCKKTYLTSEDEALEKKLVCEVCSARFGGNHRQVESGNKPLVIPLKFDCLMCKTNFMGLNSLVYHVKRSHRGTPFCETCAMCFESQADLKSHDHTSTLACTCGDVNCKVCAAYVCRYCYIYFHCLESYSFRMHGKVCTSTKKKPKVNESPAEPSYSSFNTSIPEMLTLSSLNTSDADVSNTQTQFADMPNADDFTGLKTEFSTSTLSTLFGETYNEDHYVSNSDWAQTAPIEIAPENMKEEEGISPLKIEPVSIFPDPPDVDDKLALNNDMQIKEEVEETPNDLMKLNGLNILGQISIKQETIDIKEEPGLEASGKRSREELDDSPNKRICTTNGISVVPYDAEGPECLACKSPRMTDNAYCEYCKIISDRAIFPAKFECSIEADCDGFLAWSLLALEKHTTKKHQGYVYCHKCQWQKQIGHACEQPETYECECFQKDCATCIAYVCSVCLLTFRRDEKRIYLAHLEKSCERIVPVGKGENDVGRKCFDCLELYFIDKDEEKTQEKHVCKVCQEIRDGNKVSLKFACAVPECEVEFWNLMSLLHHHRLFHNDRSLCQECGKEGGKHDHTPLKRCRCNSKSCHICAAYVCKHCLSLFKFTFLKRFKMHRNNTVQCTQCLNYYCAQGYKAKYESQLAGEFKCTSCTGTNSMMKVVKNTIADILKGQKEDFTGDQTMSQPPKPKRYKTGKRKGKKSLLIEEKHESHAENIIVKEEQVEPMQFNSAQEESNESNQTKFFDDMTVKEEQDESLQSHTAQEEFLQTYSSLPGTEEESFQFNDFTSSSNPLLQINEVLQARDETTNPTIVMEPSGHSTFTLQHYATNTHYATNITLKFQCKGCTSSFMGLNGLMYHTGRTHKDMGICNMCGEQFSNSIEMAVHNHSELLSCHCMQASCKVCAGYTCRHCYRFFRCDEDVQFKNHTCFKR